MEEVWRTVSEDYIIVQPNPPRSQNQISEKQADAINQMVQENGVRLHSGHQGEKILQVGQRVVELKEDSLESGCKLRMFWHGSETAHAVAPPGLLSQLGMVAKAYRYDYEQLRPRSFGQLKGLGEEEADYNADNSSLDLNDSKDKKYGRIKTKIKAPKRPKDTTKAVAEFTARCLKDLKKKLIKENALRKTTRAKKIMLLKGKRGKVVRIEVENVNCRG